MKKAENMSLSEKTKNWIDAYCRVSLKGKTVLITGANSGVGFKTAETVLYLGADVIMACRNIEKAEAAAQKLRRGYPDSSVKVMRLDLADLSLIEAFSAELIKNSIDVDVFLNNAGVYHQPGKTTADGFELIAGTNYIGAYYLCEKVLPYLETLGHEVVLVNTISMVYKLAGIDYDDFYFSNHYGNLSVYARSKLCLAKYSYALAQRYKNTNIRVYMSHPGITITPLGVNSLGKPFKRLAGAGAHLFNPTEKSALSLIYILSHDIPQGSIIGPKRCFGGWGYSEVNRISGKAKSGSGELIAFTENEIRKHKSR